MDLGQLTSQGINPRDAKLIIIKAAVSHKDAYDPIASQSFYIDSQGLCTSNLKRLPFKKIGNKIISLDYFNRLKPLCAIGPSNKSIIFLPSSHSFIV